MDMQQALRRVVEGQHLSEADMLEVMHIIMGGQATDAQIGGFLVALRMKGETVEEITAAAKVMRELATPVPVDGAQVIDIVGTGGDGLHTFNISTTTCFVAAAAGAKVAKHGNRSVSSSSGSADVLEAAGVNLQLSPAQVAQCINEIGVGFMFAPAHHSAMKHAIGPRKEMGLRTIFNLLGPLTNPAGAKRQLMGVFSPDWLEPLAEALRNLGSEQVMIVCAEDGMDEISLAAPTRVAELKHGVISTYRIQPEDFGLNTQPLDEIIVNNAAESVEMLCGVLQDKPGAARDIVLLNAGAAIYTAGLCDSLGEGVEKASAALRSGEPAQKMAALELLSNRF